MDQHISCAACGSFEVCEYRVDTNTYKTKYCHACWEWYDLQLDISEHTQDIVPSSSSNTKYMKVDKKQENKYRPYSSKRQIEHCYSKRAVRQFETRMEKKI